MDADRLARINMTVDALLLRCAAGPKSPLAMLHDCLEEFAHEGRESWEIDLIRSIAERVIRERQAN
jgi:hypothetical protein